MSIRAYDNPRERDQWVVVERNTPLRQPQGSEKADWQKLAGAFMRVDGAKAGEPFVADGVRTVRGYTFWAPAVFITRHCVTTADRLRWNGRVFDITDLPDQQVRGRLMPVLANAGLNAG